MFLFAAERRLVGAVTMVACVAAVAACGAADDAAAVSGGNVAAIEAAHAATPAIAVAAAGAANITEANGMPGEVGGEEAAKERVQGRWRVIDTAGSGAMAGRILSFSDTALGWEGADGKEPAGCPDPFYHIVSDAVQARKFAPAFAAGWRKFGLADGQVGAMHAWECGDAEATFGPAEPAGGSLFYPVGDDQLVMNWDDGAVLLLRREK